MTIRLHRGDLPELTRYGAAVAIDTETLGLNPHRDRLCVVQLSPRRRQRRHRADRQGRTDAPNLKRLLADPAVLKIFHFARFDIARAATAPRRHAGAGLLHQDRLEAGAHLYRPARAEGSRARTPGHRPVQAAAILRLGRRDADARRSSPTRPPTCCICMRCKEKLDAMLAREGRTELARPASSSCRPGRGSISPAGPRPTSSPTADAWSMIPRSGHRFAEKRSCSKK